MDLAQSLLAHTARCVMMPISAFLFRRAQWHKGKFLTLITCLSVSSVPDPDPEESSASDEAAEDLRTMALGYVGRVKPTTSDSGCWFGSVWCTGLESVSFHALSSARDDSASCGRMGDLQLRWGPQWPGSTWRLRATPIQLVPYIEPLLIRRFPHLRLETPHGRIDSQFVLLWFLPAAGEEWVDGFGGECWAEGVQHGCELDTGNAVCIICIVLFEVLLPELLVEGVVGLVFPSADRVLELENKINV